MDSKLQANATSQNPSSAIDPVCGMEVDPAKARASYAHDGQTHYFCCPSCLDKFRADPQRYIGARAEVKPSPAPSHGAGYTCPMHPEVRNAGPGACPICGMALEPRVLAASDEPDPELTDMKRRFLISLLLGLPLFVLSMGEMLLGRFFQDRRRRDARPVVGWNMARRHGADAHRRASTGPRSDRCP